MRNVCTDPQTVAEQLNKNFSSVFMEEDVPHIPDSAHAKMNLTTSLHDVMIDEGLALKTLQKLRSDKATTPCPVKKRPVAFLL